MAEHHITPVRTYLIIFGALLVGTALTVLAAEWDLGVLNNFVAMAIAVTKAVLVLVFFMHLRYSTRMTVLTAIAGFFWLALMIGMIGMDYMSRNSSLLPVAGK
jgi:cytochrome c oxidase subunit 4